MKILPVVRSTIGAMIGNPLRSVLTMIGVVIGVAAVLLVLALGRGAKQFVVNQVSAFGSDLIGILPGKSDKNGPPAAVFGGVIPTLTSEDVAVIRRLPHVVSATGYLTTRGTFEVRGATKDASLMGVSAEYPDVENVSLQSGRFFGKDEEARLAKVVVLGSKVKQELFGGSDAEGQTVRFKNTPFTVIGVLASKGSSLMGNQDETAYTPIGIVQRELLNVRHVSYIRAKKDADVEASIVESEITALLRHRHHITDPDRDDFSVRSAQQGMEIIGGITASLQAFLLAIVAISLLIGGIGIMNIMLVVVTERLQEIGLRKAIGASTRAIFTQFILESGIFGFTGGAIGIAAGWFLAFLAEWAIRNFGYDWSMPVTPGDAMLALVISGLVGILFGIYPAFRAASLSPTEAMRAQ